MSNYELDKFQMNNASNDLSHLFINLGFTNLQLKSVSWMLQDKSPTSDALKKRLNSFTNKLGQEAANISYLHSYNTKVTSETSAAELKAYMEMKGYSEAVQNEIGKIAGALGYISSVDVNGLKELVEKIKTIYTDVNNKIVDSTSVRGNWKAEAVYKDGSYTYSNGDTYVHGEYQIGAAEAHASYSGGIFKTDENGNLVLSPTFKAAAGASITAFTASGIAKVGNDMIGAGVEGNVTVGKVGAEIGVSTGLFDKNGNLNPNLHLNANAEAILVDASAEGRVTVLGTDAKVKGSVNVGIGAHANVDIGDGKIKADLGASLGLGVSLSLEIDYSKTVNAVKDAATGIYSNVQKGVSEGIRKCLKKWF
jgi:hypothetical protein